MAKPASIRAKLRGGSLAEVSEEELQQLSGQTGRAAPPSTPLESKAIGAGPDASKMAGTPAQQMSAIRIGLQSGGDEPANLQDTQRRQQVRTTRTEGEESQIEEGGRLGGIEGLGERVEGLARGLSQQVADSDVVNKLALAADTDPSISGDLERLLANPKDSQALLNINNKMGITDINQMLTADQILSNYQNVSDQITDIAAERFAAQTANVSDLDLEALGFNSLEEVADLLNVPAEELAGMGIEDLINFTQAAVEDEFTRSEDLRAIVSDPSIGPAERAEARRVLREMGAVGVKGVESNLDDIADQIESADTVTFAGEEIPIADMLEDEYVSGVIANYLLAPEGSPNREALEESDPELAEWINNNKETLEGVVEGIDQGIRDFAELQEENRRIAQSDVGELSDNTMEALFSDWGQIKAEQYTTPPALEVLRNKSIPQSQRASLLQAIEEVSKGGLPNQVRELASLNEGQLNQAGATNINGPEWQDTSRFLRIQQRLSRADTENPDQLAEAISDGLYKTYAELEEAAKETTNRKISGLFGPIDKGPLDALGMSVLEGAGVNTVQDSIRNAVGNLGGMTLSAKLNKGYKTTDFNKVKSFVNQPNEVYEKLVPGALQDGYIDLDDIADYSSLDDNTLDTLFKGKVRPQDKDRMVRKVIQTDPTFAAGMADQETEIEGSGNLSQQRDKARDTVVELRKQLNSLPKNEYTTRAKLNEALRSADEKYRTKHARLDPATVRAYGHEDEMARIREREIFGTEGEKRSAAIHRAILERKIEKEQREGRARNREENKKRIQTNRDEIGTIDTRQGGK